MGSSLLLTIGSLIMLGLFMLTANGLISDNLHTAEENEYYLTALSLAQSVIDEAKSKAFDQKAIAGPISSAANLTAPVSLGPDAGESMSGPDTVTAGTFLSFSRFNDIDDYNGYQRIANTPRADGYIVSTAVEYANALYPDSSASTATYCKRMSVTVTSPYLSGPVALQYAFLY
ncbi:MAG: hypothetical protein AB1428_08515 [Bacteroidota bacterium]